MSNECITQEIDDKQFKRQMKEVGKKIKLMDKPQTIALDDLFPPQIMMKYTDTNNIEEFFRHSGLVPSDNGSLTPEVIEKIPEKQFNKYVKAHTRFKSWEEMKARAGGEWVLRRLRF